MRLLLLCAVIAASSHAVDGGQAPRGGSNDVNTWAARTTSGLTFGGTWTAVEDQKAGTVTGTWILIGPQGRISARGAWSAAKSPSGWTGNWRAATEGRQGEYSGTWSAGVDLKATAGFTDLFARAAQSAVSGTWKTGRQSGAWTIQVNQ